MQVADGAIIDVEFGTDPERVLAPIHAKLPEGGLIVEVKPKPGNVRGRLRPRKFIVGRTVAMTKAIWLLEVVKGA